MKGRIIGSLFALPFFAVGVWMLWSVGSTLLDAWQTSNWVPVEARLTTAGYETHRGDDSNTYEAYARYTYTYQSQSFKGDRVGLASGSDNIGDFQQDLGARLSATMARGETITVWVNPDDPTEAVIDRSLRWGLLGIKSIFLFVFGGIGLGLLIVIWRAPPEKNAALPMYQQSPWLLNEKWQTASIRSDSKSAMWGAWAFAVLWNLISAPLPFLIHGEVLQKQNYLALIGLLFPIVGIGLLVWAIRRTREWHRFGATPVVLDPFPGSIGGHVGGTIEMKLPFDSANTFLVTLTSVDSYVSGSGDSRSRREKALWQDELVAYTESTAEGTRLTFRFEVPEGLDESNPEQSGDNYHLWRLNIRATLPAADLDRNFNVPVFATATESELVADRAAESSRIEQDAIFDKALRDQVRVSVDGVGKTLVYPMGRNFLSNFSGFSIGSIFAAAGGYMIAKEGMLLFGGVFASTGGIIALAALYMMFKSLDVRQQSNSIVTVRRWLGIPIRKREIRRSDFSRFEKVSNMQTQSGSKHVMYYKVIGVDRHANEVILGEGFRGESGANAAIRFLSQELGIRDADAITRRKRDRRGDEYANEF